MNMPQNKKEIADDAYCAHLVDEYESSTDKGDFVSFDDAAAMCGINLENSIAYAEGQKGDLQAIEAARAEYANGETVSHNAINWN